MSRLFYRRYRAGHTRPPDASFARQAIPPEETPETTALPSEQTWACYARRLATAPSQPPGLYNDVGNRAGSGVDNLHHHAVKVTAGTVQAGDFASNRQQHGSASRTASPVVQAWMLPP